MLQMFAFITGVVLVVFTTISMLFQLLDTLIKLALFSLPKSSVNQFTWSFKPLGLTLMMSLGISLISLFFEAAKTFVLLSSN